MARMYDEIVSGNVELPWYAGGDMTAARALRALANTAAVAQVVVIDNVAEYYFLECGKPCWSFDDGDFPNLAPPFPLMWFEWRTPGAGMVNHNGKMRRSPGDGVVSHSTGVLMDAQREDSGGWHIATQVFRKDSRRAAPVALLLGPAFRVDARGAYVPASSTAPSGHSSIDTLGCIGVDYGQLRAFGDEQRTVNDALQVVKVAALAMGFMHCKNVNQRPVSPPAKLSKKWARKTGKPLARYRVLDIDPVGQTPSNHNGATGAGSGKALHICRGHFATYTEEAPLFGRVTGTFWKPQHVRGSGTNGVVVKDYRVLSP